MSRIEARGDVLLRGRIPRLPGLMAMVCEDTASLSGEMPATFSSRCRTAASTRRTRRLPGIQRQACMPERAGDTTSSPSRCSG